MEWENPAISLSPASSEDPVGTAHTVTAAVTDPTNGAPVAGARVRFTIANVETTVGVTSASGQASLTYSGRKQGTETIEAVATEVNGFQLSPEPTATAQQTWFKPLGLDTTISVQHTNGIQYGYTLVETPTLSSLTLARGALGHATYTIVATRVQTSSSEQASVSGSICVTDDLSENLTGLEVRDQVLRSDGATIATQTLASAQTLQVGQTRCFAYALSFTPSPGVNQYTGQAEARADKAGRMTGALKNVDFTLPPATRAAEDVTASIDDHVAACTAGLTCKSGSTFLTTDRDGPQTFIESVNVANSALCGSGSLQDAASIVGADTGKLYGTSTAQTAVISPCGGSPPQVEPSPSAPAPGATLPVSSAPVVASPLDLVLTKRGAPASVLVGRPVTWTLTVTNNGPASATGVSVADVLPLSSRFRSAATTSGSCPMVSQPKKSKKRKSHAAKTVVKCFLNKIDKGATATITIVTTATAAGTTTNHATVTATETDSNAANNSATAKVTVKRHRPRKKS